MLNPRCEIINEIELPAHRMKIETDIHRWRAAIPDWVRQLTVKYRPADDDDAAARVEVHYDYWQMAVTVFDHYFRAPLKIRRSYFFHEMIHAHLAPLSDHYDAVEKGAGVARDSTLWNLGMSAEERAVESITNMLGDILR